MKRLLLAVLLYPLAGAAEPHEEQTHRAIQRALMELDQRTAQFARGVPLQPLPAHAGRPLHPDPVVAREWRPYERMKAAAGNGHVLRLPPPVVRAEKPLPLPGRPRHGVEPVPSTGLGG